MEGKKKKSSWKGDQLKQRKIHHKQTTKQTKAYSSYRIIKLNLSSRNQEGAEAGMERERGITKKARLQTTTERERRTDQKGRKRPRTGIILL